MIRVNLAKRKQVVSGGGAQGDTRGTGLGRLKLPTGFSKITLDTDQLKSLPIKRFLIPIVIGIAASYYLDGLKDDEMSKATDTVTQLSNERIKLASAAGKIKTYETMRKSMDADEIAMKSKLDTIQKLISERTNPPKLLRALAVSIPKDVWLTVFKAGEQEVSFNGFSLDFNQITDFVKNLSESAFFTQVEIKGAQSSPKDESGSELASFELTAKRR